MNNIFIQEISCFYYWQFSFPTPAFTHFKPQLPGTFIEDIKLKSLILGLLSLLYVIVFKLSVPFEELFSTLWQLNFCGIQKCS